MKNPALAICLIGMVLSVGTAQAEDPAQSLMDYVALCEKNTNCSNTRVGEDIMFKLRTGSRIRSMLCRKDSTCVVFLARGQFNKIDDMAVLLRTN